MTGNMLIQRYHEPRQNLECRLFCLPHAGAGAAAFSDLHRFMPDTIDVCSIRLPGRESKILEPGLCKMGEIAGMLNQELWHGFDLPYALVGQCFGALISFEMSLRLNHEPVRQPDLIFILGQPAPGSYAIESGNFEEFFADMTANLPEELAAEPEFFELLEPTLRADYTAVSTYNVDEAACVSIPISVFLGHEDDRISLASMLAWRYRTTGDFTLRVIPGGHLLSETSLEIIARKIHQDWTRSVK